MAFWSSKIKNLVIYKIWLLVKYYEKYFSSICAGSCPDRTNFVITCLCALLKMKSYLAGRRGKLYVTDILPGGYKNELRICHLEVKLHCRLSNWRLDFFLQVFTSPLPICSNCQNPKIIQIHISKIVLNFYCLNKLF